MTDSKSIVLKCYHTQYQVNCQTCYMAAHIKAQDKQIADQDKLIAEQYEDNVDAVADLDAANKQIAELKEFQKYPRLQDAETIDTLKAKITELQAVVDRLADPRPFVHKRRNENWMKWQTREDKALIEFAAKHATPEDK